MPQTTLYREQKIIRDMLEYLEGKGFHVSKVDDGVTWLVVNVRDAVDVVMAADSARIYFKEPNAGSVLIVLEYNQEVGESISDWTIPSEGSFGMAMDQFTQEIYREDGKYHV